MTADVSSLSYTDRRGGLIFFGILQIALGLLALLVTALTAFTFLFASHARVGAPPVPLPTNLMIAELFFYVPVAIWFVVLGIASMLPRRWAWALSLVESWIWLVFGIMTALVVFFVSDRFMPPMPPGQGAFVFGCMAVIFGIFLVALPIAFVLFYRSPNVKATVWARDPRTRWTDSIPLSVLGGGMLMIICGPMILVSAASYKAMPLGNMLIRGWTAIAILAAFGALSAFSGVQLLRLRKSGWWGTLAFIVVTIAYGFSFLNIDTNTWHEVLAIDLPREQFDRIIGMYRSPLFFGWIGIIWIAYVAYLLYIRRYFFGERAGGGAATAGAASGNL